jgi:hypothetical protein
MSAFLWKHGLLTLGERGRIKLGKSISGGAPMHTETAAQSSASSQAQFHDLHANCPNCGRLMANPVLDVHHDGTHCCYCSSCRTEVFEASFQH